MSSLHASARPLGGLQDLLLDHELHESVRAADAVVAVHPITGERVGVFYGPPDGVVPLEVAADPVTDDLAALYAIVMAVKGSCSYRFEGEP